MTTSSSSPHTLLQQRVMQLRAEVDRKQHVLTVLRGHQPLDNEQEDPRRSLLARVRTLREQQQQHTIQQQHQQTFTDFKNMAVALAIELEHEGLKLYLARDVKEGMDELCQHLFQVNETLVMTLRTSAMVCDLIQPLRDVVHLRAKEACMAVEHLIEAILPPNTQPKPSCTASFDALKLAISALPVTNRAAVKRSVLEVLTEIDDSIREFDELATSVVPELGDDDDDNDNDDNNDFFPPTALTDHDRQRLTSSIDVLKSLKDYLRECAETIMAHDLHDTTWLQHTYDAISTVRTAYLDFGVEMYPPTSFTSFSNRATILTESVFALNNTLNSPKLSELCRLFQQCMDIACT